MSNLFSLRVHPFSINWFKRIRSAGPWSSVWSSRLKFIQPVVQSLHLILPNLTWLAFCCIFLLNFSLEVITCSGKSQQSWWLKRCRPAINQPWDSLGFMTFSLFKKILVMNGELAEEPGSGSQQYFLYLFVVVWSLFFLRVDGCQLAGAHCW